MLQRVNGLYLQFENKRVLPVEFVDFSNYDRHKMVDRWDKQQLVVYYVIESGVLSGYILDGKNRVKLINKQPKRWWQIWR